MLAVQVTWIFCTMNDDGVSPPIQGRLGDRVDVFVFWVHGRAGTVYRENLAETAMREWRVAGGADAFRFVPL